MSPVESATSAIAVEGPGGGQLMAIGKHVDFGMSDAKGRRIGAEVHIWTSEYGCRVYVQATRDGQGYGPCAPEKPVADIDAAHAEVQRRLTSMVKRYVKLTRDATEAG